MRSVMKRLFYPQINWNRMEFIDSMLSCLRKKMHVYLCCLRAQIGHISNLRVLSLDRFASKIPPLDYSTCCCHDHIDVKNTTQHIWVWGACLCLLGCKSMVIDTQQPHVNSSNGLTEEKTSSALTWTNLRSIRVYCLAHPSTLGC